VHVAGVKGHFRTAFSVCEFISRNVVTRQSLLGIRCKATHMLILCPTEG